MKTKEKLSILVNILMLLKDKYGMYTICRYHHTYLKYIQGITSYKISVGMLYYNAVRIY